MKRILTLLLALALSLALVFAFTACSGGGNSSNDDDDTAEDCDHRDADDNGKCDECGETYTDGKDVTEPEHTHTPTNAVVENEIEATCTVGKNYDEVIYCSECGEEISRESISTSALGHTDIDADRICDVCGKRTPSKGLKYKLINFGTEYKLTRIGTCTDTDIVIPTTYLDLPVTSIGEKAFQNCTSLTSITIPDSVTSIASYAFYNCTSLTDVYYTGTEEEWAKISIGNYNSPLTNATIHYNYVSEEE